MKYCLLLLVFFNLSIQARVPLYHKVYIKSGKVTAKFLISKKMPVIYRNKLINDLNFLAAISDTNQATPLHLEIFGGTVSGETYLKWLAKRVYRIRFDVKYPHWNAYNSTNRNIFLKKSSPRRHPITLQSGYFSNRNQISRISSLIHEARHTEGYGHVDCKNLDNFDPLDRLSRIKFSRPEFGCDDTHLGAYGAKMVFKFNLKLLFAEQNDLSSDYKEGSMIVDPQARKLLSLDHELF